MQVSDMEKKPEHASSTASAANNHQSGKSSVTLLLEDEFQHDLAAHVGDEQSGGSRDGPVHGLAPAPPAHVVAHEQAAEDEPRDDREDGLVGDREGFVEEPLGEERAGQQREREQHE